MRDFLLAMLSTSVTMSVLALLYILATPFLEKRCSAKSRYYAWLIVVVGFLILFRPQLGYAVIDIRIPAEAESTNAQAFMDAGNNPPLLADHSYTAPLSAASIPSIWDIVGIVWATGMCASLAFQTGRHIRFVSTICRWREAVTHGPVYELLQQLRMEAGMQSKVALYHCPCIASPMLMGLFRSSILVPHLNYEPDDLIYVFKHELVHQKRKDLCYRAVTILAIAVHWFNPIAYLMGWSIDTLCEISCDCEVIKDKNPDARLRYSEIIVGIVKYQSRLRTALSTGFSVGKTGMKKRITFIMDMGRKQFGAVLIFLAVVLSCVSGLALAATVSPAPIMATDGMPGISTPNFKGDMHYTNALPAMTDEEYQQAIIGQAIIDFERGEFQNNSSGFNSLIKGYVSAVSPDREGMIAEGLSKIAKEPQPDPIRLQEIALEKGSVRYHKTDNQFTYGEFYDTEGNMITSYSNGRWADLRTPAEAARQTEFCSLYNEAWGGAKASSGSSTA